MGALIGIVIAAAALCCIYFFMTSTKASENAGWMKEYRYAHRGLHNERMPENSLEAFQNAIDHGYAIELDVHLSKDGHVMVFHDDTLARVTGESGKIEDYTLAELKRMRLAGTQCTIPTLREALALVDGRMPLLIETKNTGGAGQLEVSLYQIMREYRGKYALQSFSPFSMRWFKSNAPEVLRGQLSATFSYGAEEIPKWKRSMLKHLCTNFVCRPHFISYEMEGYCLPVVQRMRKNGLPLLIWTVRSEENKERILKNADAVIFENFNA
ncbi:glycerophosphodiester phosphodiesterase family protein [Christensenella timonensis]|uniref:glycerophosphodiester phosphodiesterase family protein n=1 Tax=Christensenella timonensis TaxID=1816678 RepID=UPI0009EF2039|nr:glycerophosphodiester phosphodiesterase family protein [Christensenella timonensis]